MAGNSVELEIQNANSGIYIPVARHHIVQGIDYRGEEV
jgi:hypothetical protein